MIGDEPEIKRAASRLSDQRLGIVLHRDYQILHISPDIVTVLGYLRPDKSVLGALDLLDEPARAEVVADGQRCRAGESLPLRAVALRRSIGSPLPTLLAQEQVELADGPAILWLLALGLVPPGAPASADELREAERELPLLRATLEAVPVGLALVSGEIVSVMHNRLYEAYTGIPAELLGKSTCMDEHLRFQIRRGTSAQRFLDEAQFTPEQIEGCPPLATILRCQKARGSDGEVTEEEVGARLAWVKLFYGPSPRPDGGHWSIPGEFTRGDTGQVIEMRSSPVPGIGWVQVFTDVTARRRAEEALRAANKKLETTLSELQTAQAQLVLQEKMATLGQLTAGIAHEIKNPLNFINNFSSLTVDLIDELGEQIGSDRSPAIEETLAMIAKNLKIIGQHGQRTDSIVRTMLLHSRSGAAEWERTDLAALLEDACNLALHGARANFPTISLSLARHFPDRPVIGWIVPQDIVRVVLNLLSNAFYATAKRTKSGGEEGYQPRVSITLEETGGKIEIAVLDNGIGMDEAVRSRLFTPFFTTKAPGEGTGLGLSLSYDVIVHGHGGDLTVDSQPMSHTEMRIRLPLRAWSPEEDLQSMAAADSRVRPGYH